MAGSSRRYKRLGDLCALCKYVYMESCGDVVPGKLLPARRKVKPSHGRKLTGRVPLLYGRGMVPFESNLEKETIHWIRDVPGLISIQAQPFTVSGSIRRIPRTYTPDYLVEFSRTPPALAALGFGRKTVLEVKPLKYTGDELTRLKLCLCRKVTKLPTIFITEHHVQIKLDQGGPIVH